MSSCFGCLKSSTTTPTQARETGSGFRNIEFKPKVKPEIRHLDGTPLTKTTSGSFNDPMGLTGGFNARNKNEDVFTGYGNG